MTLKTLVHSLDVFHSHAKRDIRGNLFGVEVPAWVIFHAVLGYVILAIGLVSILLRIPLKPVRRIRWLHPYLGYAWVFGTIWMPVTAIWCVYRFTGWDVIAFFIFSMYFAIQLAWVSIKLYRNGSSADCIDTSPAARLSWKVKLWKWVHAVLMTYSFAMLLGAGISFPFRAVDDYAKTSHP